MSGAGKEKTQKKAQAESRSDRPGYFDHLLENTPLCVFVLDWKLRIIYMNPVFQRLAGYRKADAASGQVIFSVHPDDQDEAESSIIMALVGRRTRCQCRVRGANGAFHPLKLEVSPMPGEDSCRVLCVDSGSA